MINYEIIATGSKGNAVAINGEILIDCGVPFKALRHCYRYLRLVLLTHVHQDHFNPTTIKRLASERPSLRWGVPEWLVPYMADGVGVSKRSIDVLLTGHDYGYAMGFGIVVRPIQLTHNVPNCGYSLTSCGLERMFYATDTSTLDGIEAKNYDLYMVEANYSEAEITERIRQKQDAGEFCHEWDVLKNHLSKEKCDDWLYRNMGPNSRYVYLHRHEDHNA